MEQELQKYPVDQCCYLCEVKQGRKGLRRIVFVAFGQICLVFFKVT